MNTAPAAIRCARPVLPADFDAPAHYYPRVLNAQIHPLVSFFLNLSSERVVSRYTHLHPLVSPTELHDLLHYQPRYLPWAGADLFYVTTKEGNRRMVVIEVNSAPSGQKSMPPLVDHDEQGGYRTLIENGFLPYLRSRRLPEGGLAVLFDKNEMEASGYAAALAEATGETVLLCPFYDNDADAPARFTGGILQLRDANGQWHNMRAAFRYVTQRPWNRIPLQTKTVIFNPVLACLAGGRNKMLAAKAYDLMNSELAHSGLKINVPETIYDVAKDEIPIWVRKFNGHAVIKVPYSNAGQGVFTITSSDELAEFMQHDYPYDQFIVQSLIGNKQWSSVSQAGQFYHVGTIPNKKNKYFVADLRMMVVATPIGFRPVAIYARRAQRPLEDEVAGSASWDMLGTNLSIKTGENTWETDSNRLLIMDRKDFNALGIGLDDLIEGFIQTVLSVRAIDRFAHDLVTKRGQFRSRLFRSMNNDPRLINEIVVK